MKEAEEKGLTVFSMSLRDRMTSGLAARIEGLYTAEYLRSRSRCVEGRSRSMRDLAIRMRGLLEVWHVQQVRRGGFRLIHLAR